MTEEDYMESKKELNDAELAEWRAGEARRTAFWDKRVNTLIDNVEEVLTLDQMQAVRDYWSQWKENVNPAWAAWYTRGNGLFDPCYIPNNIYFGRISRALNRRDYLNNPLLQDKNYLDLIFPDLIRPVTIVRNVYGQFLDRNYRAISVKEATLLCLREEEFVLKPSLDTKGAKNVEFISTEGKTKEEMTLLLQAHGKDYIVQRVIKQHPWLGALNPDSVNTIRVLSLLWNDETMILGSAVRIGTKGVRVDNLVRSHGVSCAIGDDGCLIRTAYDKMGFPVERLPNGIRFEHYPIPGYDRAIALVKESHARLAHFRLIGWDISITEDGEPVLIEANLDVPELAFHQFAMGPVFGNGELLREVLEFTYEQYPMY